MSTSPSPVHVLDFEDCLKGGWRDSERHGQEFVNQGDCVSYYASNGKSEGPKTPEEESEDSKA